MNVPAPVASLVQKHGQRFLRYSGVAAFNVVLGQTLLLLFYAGFGMQAVAANLAAAAIGAGPAYLLNRYWVWEKKTRNHFWGEIVPFWAIMLLGVVFSTVAVAIAERQWDNALAVSLASLSAYGIVWVMKYFIFDNYLFVPEPEPEPVATA